MLKSILSVTSPAASHDLTVLDTLKLELGITDTSKDDLLTNYIRQASNGIISYCRRMFASEGITETFRHELRPSRIWRDYYWRCPEGVDSLPLGMAGPYRRAPVTAVESVTLDDGAPLDSSLYEIDPDTSILYSINSSNRPSHFHFGQKAVVVYTAGYDLLDELPFDVERACLEWSKDLYFGSTRDPSLQTEQAWRVATFTYFDRSKAPTAIPPAVVSLLGPYRAMAFA